MHHDDPTPPRHGQIITADYPRQCRNIRSAAQFVANPSCRPGMVRTFDYTNESWVKTARHEARRLNDQPEAVTFMGNDWRATRGGIIHGRANYPGVKVTTHTVNSKPPFGIHFDCPNERDCDRSTADMILTKDTKATITYGHLTNEQMRHLMDRPPPIDPRRRRRDEEAEEEEEEEEEEDGSDAIDATGDEMGARRPLGSSHDRRKPSKHPKRLSELGAAIGPRFVNKDLKPVLDAINN